MTGTTSAIEWFLARDGQQHGPLSETEMRTFVDMGHLREHDLVWRSGFADWRPAPEVFAIREQPMPQQVVPQQVVPNPTVEGSGPATAGPSYASDFRPVNLPGVRDTRGPDPYALEPASHGPDDNSNATGASQPALQSPNQLAAAAAFRELERNAGPASQLQEREDWTSKPVEAREPAAPAAASRAKPLNRQAQPVPVQARQLQTKPVRPGLAADHSPNDLADVSLMASSQLRPGRKANAAPKRGFGVAKFAAALAVALLVGVGTLAVVKRDELSAFLPASGSGAGTSMAAAPFAATGNNPDSVDDSFQRTPIWRHIKAEFPEWYADRVSETAKLSAEKRGDTVIAKHLAEAVVALRRKHADQALTASPDRLRFVAAAFVDNLQALAKQNVDTCYGFISQGETYPAVLEMLQKQGTNEPLQKQVIAVFEAISDGRKSPQSYLPPRKTDYDALAAELTARGWSQADLQTFSDPRALGRASPQQVCKMVQDWFTAQISIKDPAAQLRLLVESLRPVVAG